MIAAVEILQIGPDSRLFQVCDGELFGQVQFPDDAPRPFAAPARMAHPDVLAFLRGWLERDGALIGTQRPPRLPWQRVQEAVPAARQP